MTPMCAGFPSTHRPPRGTLIVKMHRSRKICALVWIDSKPVWLLSTSLNPVDPTCVAVRWMKRAQIDFPTSLVLLEYQRNMRGVDVVDQQRGYYTVALESNKWWHRGLTFVLDSSLQNSFIIYKEDAERVGLQLYTRQLWHYTLAKYLVEPFVRVNVPRSRIRILQHQGFHHSERHADVRRHCIICRKRTRQFCGGCGGQFMCNPRCYVLVHIQPHYAAMIYG
jgi:hypothetical protein